MDYQDKKKSGAMMTSQLRWQLMFRQEGTCFLCLVPEWKLGKRLEAHRLKPGNQGGKYLAANVVLVCRKCHTELEREVTITNMAEAIFYKSERSQGDK